jgi:type IV pilus assembly protein PilX
MNMNAFYQHPKKRSHQIGMSLIMVMLILVAASLLGIGAAQISMMSERGARNDRDQQMAWQAAEASIMDAESDIFNSTSTRKSIFDGKTQSAFISGCGSSGTSIGLCALATSGKPAWLTVDFTDTSTSAHTTALGTFTGRTFAAGGAGIQPAAVPRYVIEIVPDTIGDKSDPSFVYRITSMGFGPRADIQAVLQTLYRI